MILVEHREALLSALPQRDRRPIWQIADGRYGMDRTRPAGEKWQLSRTPWWKQPLDDFKSDDVREIVIMAGSQCSKTAGMLTALAWAVKHSPAPMLWITGNDDLAKDASQERVAPTLERCPDAAPLLLNNRLDKTTWKIRLKTCTVDIAGAQSSTSLEQNPYRFVFGDEVRQWPPGSLQKVEKRQRSFSDAKRCFFSTPMLKGDEFHQRYLAGTQCEWVWPCMKCGAENKLEWKAVKYDRDLASADSAIGRKDYSGGDGASGDFAQSGVRLVCVGCDHAHADKPVVRRHIIEQGHWQAQNLAPQLGVVSYHWSALLPPWVQWADLVKEWHQANDHKKRNNLEPLKVFICESLGEPWEDKIEVADYAQITQRRSGWVRGVAWPDGKRTFLTADVQLDMIYWTARAWGLGGVSQQIDFGRVFTFDDLRAVQTKLAIRDNDVAVDSGFRTSEVYQVCQRWGWHPMKGAPVDHFVHHESDKTAVRRIWTASQVDPAAQGGAQVTLFVFSADSAKDMLALYMAGKGPVWGLVGDVTDEYCQQLAAEKAEIDGKTGKRIWKQISKNNHWLDCESMNLMAAVIIGLAASEEKKS